MNLADCWKTKIWLEEFDRFHHTFLKQKSDWLFLSFFLESAGVYQIIFTSIETKITTDIITSKNKQKIIIFKNINYV